MKKKLVIITLMVFLLDQLIKYFVCKYLTNVTIFPGFLSLVYAENTGVAFSMFSGGRVLIILISFILLMFLGYLLHKEYLSKNKKEITIDFTYGLLFGGILGNLFDRIIRGVVIDYVSLNLFGYNFPIFNLADLMITIGVILMVIQTIKGEEKGQVHKG